MYQNEDEQGMCCHVPAIKRDEEDEEEEEKEGGDERRIFKDLEYVHSHSR